jgi:phosphodiesterase/alkaline phosphatase D-like protein
VLGTPVAAVVATPAPVSADPYTYTSLSNSVRSTCVVAPDGTGLCWGSNYGQYLIAESRDAIITVPTKVSLPNGEKFATISAGHGYSNCALAQSGRAYCWGEHHLGNYFITTSRTPVIVEFPNDMRVTEVQGGSANACATNAEGQLWCWGDVLTLGTTETEPTRTPLRVSMPDNGAVVSFTVGITNICAITENANAYCWGDNRSGEMGLGFATQKPYLLPTLVTLPGSATIASFALGRHRSCALDTNGGGWCWGDNYEGSFGNNSYLDSATPQRVLVPNNEPLSNLSTGWYHTCAITTSGTPWCWGSGDWGRLGTGTTLGGKTFRQPVLPAGVVLTSIHAGLSTTCARDTTNNVWCFGGVTTGRNGSGSLTPNLFPVRIAAVGTPTVSVASIGNIGADTIVINSSLNGNGKRTTGVLQFSTSATFDTSSSAVINAVPREGSYIAISGSNQLSALAPRTRYFIRVVATNAFGTTASEPVSLTTIGSEPTASDLKVDEFSGNEGTFAALVNPGHLRTAVSVVIDTDSNFTNPTTHFAETITGSTDLTVRHTISNLRARTEYFVRYSATNVLGTTQSGITSFTTLGSVPTAVVASSTSTTNAITSVVTVATGDTYGTVELQVSATQDFASVRTSESSTFRAQGPTQHTLNVSGLTYATEYWVRALVNNEVGSATSEPTRVITAGSAPILSALSISSDTTSARISGTVTTTGLQTFATLSVSSNADMSNATEYFMYSGTHGTNHSISGSLSNLAQRTTYYATITASNAIGTTTTDAASFRLAIPVGVAINNDDASTTSPQVSLSFVLPSSAVAVRVSNSSNFSAAKIFRRITTLEWTLATSFNSATVWVEFIDANGVATTYSDSITLPDAATPTGPATPAGTAVSGIFTLSSSVSATSTRTVSVAASVRKAGVTKVQTKIGKKLATHKVKKMRNGSYAFSVVAKKGTVSMRFINKNGKPGKWQTVRFT